MKNPVAIKMNNPLTPSNHNFSYTDVTTENSNYIRKRINTTNMTEKQTHVLTSSMERQPVHRIIKTTPILEVDLTSERDSNVQLHQNRSKKRIRSNVSNSETVIKKNRNCPVNLINGGEETDDFVFHVSKSTTVISDAQDYTSTYSIIIIINTYYKERYL